MIASTLWIISPLQTGPPWCGQWLRKACRRPFARSTPMTWRPAVTIRRSPSRISADLATKCCSGISSLRLDAGFLDHGGPLHKLALDVFAKLARAAPEHLDAGIDEPPADLRLFQCFVHLRGQDVDHRRRRI